MFDEENYAPLYGAYDGDKLVGMAQLYVSQDMLADFKKEFALVIPRFLDFYDGPVNAPLCDRAPGRQAAGGCGWGIYSRSAVAMWSMSSKSWFSPHMPQMKV